MSKLAIIFLWEGPKSRNIAMVDISIKDYTGYFSKNKFCRQWATKVLRHLVVKFDFVVSWSHFPTFPSKQCWFFHFFDSTDHSAFFNNNIVLGGRGYQRINARCQQNRTSTEKNHFLKVFQLLLSLIVGTNKHVINLQNVCCVAAKNNKLCIVFKVHLVHAYRMQCTSTRKEHGVGH